MCIRWLERRLTWSAVLPVTEPMMFWAAPVTPSTTDWRVEGWLLEDMMMTGMRMVSVFLIGS